MTAFSLADDALPVRGWMLDISRDRVPTRETLAALVDLLARCHYNQFELYMEHTFAHADQDEVWRDASPMTADDMRWLDALCAERGIALVANRNGLGHMERWLKHDGHRHRAEQPEGYELWGSHWPASTLAVTPDNLAFVQGLYEELVATTTTKAVNIGMDEPWEFGRGASRELVERDGQGKVYTDWVLGVAQPWLDRGYRVEMWGEILAHHPDEAHRLPEGLALVIWGYDSPEHTRAVIEREGENIYAGIGFDEMTATFTDRGADLWVAPGTGTWLSVTGRLTNAVQNIVDAATTAARIGAGGLLLTSWGDRGHWEGYAHLLAPLVVGGFASANPGRADELRDREVLTRLVGSVLFSDERHAGAELLVGTGMLADLLDQPMMNQTVLGAALLGFREASAAPAAIAATGAEITRLQQLSDTLADEEWVREVRIALDLAEVLLPRLRGERAPVPSALVERVRGAWLATSRPGGLEDSLAHAVDLEPVSSGN